MTAPSITQALAQNFEQHPSGHWSFTGNAADVVDFIQQQDTFLEELKAAAYNLRYCPENYRRKHLDELDTLLKQMEQNHGQS